MLGRRISLGRRLSIRKTKTEIRIGIPWAYRKYTRKLFQLDFWFLTSCRVDNDLAMLKAMAVIQKKYAKNV